jgi:hypothetical protein
MVIVVVPITARPQTLEGFASFPADTFAPGPTSGQFITAANGRTPPFVNMQPVQGISSVLRVYRVSPDFRTKTDGDGTIDVLSFVTLHDPDHHINFPIVADREFYYSSLVIERDNNQGAAAAFNKIYRVDLDDVDSNGFLVKHQIADLLNIADPDNLGGFGPAFKFPFQTIESVIPLSARTIGVLDDNNFPFSSARVPGQPDPNEFIILRLDRPLLQFKNDEHGNPHSR